MILYIRQEISFSQLIHVFVNTLISVLTRHDLIIKIFINSGKINTVSDVKEDLQKPITHSRSNVSTINSAYFVICLLTSFSSFAEARTVKSLFEMRRENVVVQQWDLSCGAAALTTLLNYQHGDFVTEKEVANALMNRPEYIKFPGLVTVRQGFSLFDLKRYVDERGYKGIGYGHLTFDDLLKKAPIIVPVNIFGYNHFVIFRGMQGNRVLLADPAWGNRTMLVDLFENIRIDFPQIGKVGFIVARADGTAEAPIDLAPRASDFVMFR
jgi:predicted double-glycine peptidase